MQRTRVQAAQTDRLTEVSEEVARQLIPGERARRERLGEIFLACVEIAREESDGFAAAEGGNDLLGFLLPRVQARLTDEDAGPRFRGGWMGTYVGPDARDIEPDAPATTDPEYAGLGQRALFRARSSAHSDGNETMLRYLGWYEQRLAHKSYAAIARREGKPAGTIRTGVARARKHVLRMVHELQHAQPAPLSGDAPPEIEPLRELWLRQDLDALEAGLEQTAERFAGDPHWLNLSALLRADRGEHDRALALYERALIFADAPSVRARVLNNLGNLCEDRSRAEDAHHYWLRAHQLLPDAPAPLMNLLVSAALAKDYASAQLYLSQLGERLSANRYSANDRDYVLRRLRENPKLAWLRETEAWRLGPARWLRSSRRGRGITLSVIVALALILPLAASAETRSQSAAPVDVAALEVSPAAERSRGGDSMGSPRGGRKGRSTIDVPPLLAGDSMGFSSRGKGRRGSS
jgi:tetratricopeptide (TPR) repeat protein